MKRKTIKNIQLCCYVALAFCVVWTLLMVKNIIVIFGYGNMAAHHINWSVNTTTKIIVIVCYLLGAVAMISLCSKAVFNIFNGLRENTIFPRSNEKIVFWIAFSDFVYLLGSWNLSVLWKDDVVFRLQYTNFVSPFFLLFFAFMYKVAADAVEENNLTV